MRDSIDRVSTSASTLEFSVTFHAVTRGRKQSQADITNEKDATPPGRTPRVSKMMSMAIKMEQLVRSGTVKDYAELARLGHVTRARISQIMDLLNLAPDLIEELLFLPLTSSGRDALTELDIRKITRIADWRGQRHRYKLFTHRTCKTC